MYQEFRGVRLMAYSTIKDPSAHFQTALYTGTGQQNNSVVNDGNSDLQPDLIWMKSRNNGYSHYLVDSSRGRDKGLYPDGDNSEVTASTSAKDLQSFDTDGFTVGEPEDANSTNATSSSGVAWQWKANGGTTSSNTDGDITSTVQANQDAGFSIVTYTGNTSNNQTVGHGLGAVPGIILIRNRSRVETWRFNHQSINNGIGMCQFNTDAAYNTTGTTLMNVAATSSVFSVSTDWSVNGNYPFVAWCWAEKQGYSKFGKYGGNGSDDGPFVYTGFKPAFLIMKRTDSTGNWVMFDTKRDTHNVTKHRLFPNLANSDNTTRNYIDLLSNGFKMRNTDVDHNASGATIIYMAFAENPFVAGGIPTTAR
jgi:hypothetical protein